MKHKIANLLLVVTSLFGYMEWGKDNSAFLFSAEAEVIRRLFTDATSVIHPLTIIPLAGQLLLLCTLFQKTPSKILTYIGMASLAILLFFLFLIGARGGNMKMLLAASPFLITCIYVIVLHIKEKKNNARLLKK